MEKKATMSFDYRLFNSTLQTKMSSEKLSLREVARESGVSASTLSRLLNGKQPDIDTFAALITWLELDANQFFHTPLRTMVQHDRWTNVYLCLLDLELPNELIEAVVIILRLIAHPEQGGTS